MKRKTRRIFTAYALESRFISYSMKNGHELNAEYLNDSIIMYLDNKEDLYKAMTATKRKPESIAWNAFIMLTDDCINEDYKEPETVFYASSQHLKDFLYKWGCGYETIAKSVRHVKETRKDLQR